MSNDIISMAREAVSERHEKEFGVWWSWEEIERFARLVEQRKCAELAEKISRMPFGDTAASFAVWIRAEHDAIACASDPAGLKRGSR